MFRLFFCIYIPIELCQHDDGAYLVVIVALLLSRNEVGYVDGSDIVLVSELLADVADEGNHS